MSSCTDQRRSISGEMRKLVRLAMRCGCASQPERYFVPIVPTRRKHTDWRTKLWGLPYRRWDAEAPSAVSVVEEKVAVAGPQVEHITCRIGFAVGRRWRRSTASEFCMHASTRTEVGRDDSSTCASHGRMRDWRVQAMYVHQT